MKTTLSIIFVSILIIVNGQKCDLKLTGQVLDKHDNEPLPYALVSYGEHQTLSDEKGLFTIQDICASKDTLRIKYAGYLYHQEVFEISKDTSIRLEPELHAEQLEVADISIDRHEQAIAHQSLTTEEIQRKSGSTLAETLESVTGVTQLKTGNNNAKPVVHGMHSNRLLLMNNGIRHEGQQWGNEHAPEIDPAIADNITVVKGASSVKYGSDAIAGVVLIEPSALRTEKGIDARINSTYQSNGRAFTNSAVINGHHKLGIPLGYRVQGTLKSAGDAHTPNYYLSNTGTNERNFSAALNSHGEKTGFDYFYSQFNSKVGIYSGSHIGNLTDLQNVVENGLVNDSASFSRALSTPYQSIEHELTKAKAYWFINDSSKLSLTYARQFNRREEYDNHGNTTEPELQFEITTHTLDIEYSHFTDHDHKTVFGVSGVRQLNDFDGRFFVPNFKSSTIGAYAFRIHKIGKWHTEYGARYDYKHMQIYRFVSNELKIPKLSFGAASLNIGGIYDLSDYTHLSVNVARAWRPPSVNELYADGLHHGAATIEKGDENIDEEKAWNFSTELHYQKQKLDIELDVFYYHFNNYIYAAPTLDYVLTIRGAFPEYRYVQAKARIYGFDFFGKYQITKRLSIANKTNVTIADNLDSSTALIGIPAPSTAFKLSYLFKKGETFRNSEIYLNYSFTSRQWRVTQEQELLLPPDSYSLVDLGFSTKIKNVMIGVECQNLFNQAYRDYMNRLRYFADDIGRSFNIRVMIPIEKSI